MACALCDSDNLICQRSKQSIMNVKVFSNKIVSVLVINHYYTILSYSRNSQKLDAREKYVLYSTFTCSKQIVVT